MDLFENNWMMTKLEKITIPYFCPTVYEQFLDFGEMIVEVLSLKKWNKMNSYWFDMIHHH